MTGSGNLVSDLGGPEFPGPERSLLEVVSERFFFMRATQWSLSTIWDPEDAFIIADPRILRGRQLLLSILFTTCYRAVHPSIENCTSLYSSVRHFWGTEALMSFAINHELVEF